MKTLNFHILIVLLLGLAMTHCSHDKASGDNPDELYKLAEEDFKDERYLTAVEKFRDIKNRFPYSSRAVDSELRIADAYYEQESYIEAESSYEIFRELHPNHPKSDYVQYRIAMSYFQEIPDSPQRDLSAAYKAIDAFKILLAKYGSSEYAKQAEEKLTEARKKLADHEHYVADFYFQRKHYLSASFRYANLLQEFSNSGYDAEAMVRLGQCYFEVRMYENARATLEDFIKRYPSSSYLSEAEGLLGKVKTKLTPAVN